MGGGGLKRCKALHKWVLTCYSYEDILKLNLKELISKLGDDMVNLKQL